MERVFLDDVDVLIVGAGPTGLTLALELRQQGVRSVVIDAADGPTPTHESRSLGMWSRTLEIFAQIGVLSDVLSRGKIIRKWNLFISNKRIGQLKINGRIPTPNNYPVSLTQGEVERILLKHFQNNGGDVHWKTKLIHLQQDQDKVTCTMQQEGKEIQAAFNWVIGCDGAKSTVRRSIDGTFEGEKYDHPFLLADFSLPWNMDPNEPLMILLHGGALAAFPLTEEGHWRLMDSTGEVDSDDPQTIVERFRSLLQEVEIEAELGDPVWTSHFHVQTRMVEHYRVKKVFLAGDAAHIHSPVGGQGMNLGIQDAHNLAWKLALVLDGAASEALLDSYQSERKPVAAETLKGTELATLCLTTGPFYLRDTLLWLISRVDWFQKIVSDTLSELKIRYPASPIITQDDPTLWETLGTLDPRRLLFRYGPQAGDRAPYISLCIEGSEVKSLFEFLSNKRHTLLLVADGVFPVENLQSIVEFIQSDYSKFVNPFILSNDFRYKGKDRVIVTSEDTLKNSYGAPGACLYLIRPDGYIGYRNQPPNLKKFKEYLSRYFSFTTAG